MNIGFTLNVLGWQLGTLNIRLDLDETDTPTGLAVPPKLMDRVSDYFATRWFARHA